MRRGMTLPSFLGSMGGAQAEEDRRQPSEGTSDKPDESYRELLQAKMASTQKTAMPNVESDELDQLEALFHQADYNHDGVVDFNEFRDVMGKLAHSTGKQYNALQLRGLFRMADLDGSGSIDFNEFIHAQRRMKKNWGTAKAAAFFSMQFAGGKK